MAIRIRRPSPRSLRILSAQLVLVALVGSSGWTTSASAAGLGSIAGQPTRPPAAQSAPEPASAAADVTSDTTNPAGVEPSIQYEDAMAHANDRIAFVPGGRVSVPFRPRAADGWPVGGAAPRALPAGRASGAAMATAAQGSTWATAPQPAPALNEPVPGLIDAAPAMAVQPVADTADPASVAGLRRQVFGFLPYWEVNSATLNYGLLSTIAYFSVGADKYGNLLKKNADGSTTTGWGGWTSSRMTNVINTAHTAGTRVVLTLSVFAWSSTQASVQGSILGSSTRRLRLAQQAAAAVRDRGADGINLDFEPIASGYGDEFVAFVRTLRSELNKIAPGYQLTFDTTGFVGNYKVADLTASGAADAMFLMGYDFRTSGSSPVGSIAAIGGPTYDVADSVDTYLSLIPASKIILGVPYYGRAWSTTSSSLNAKNQSGAKYGYSASVEYDTAADYLATYGRHWDATEQVAWTAYQRQNCTTAYGCVTSWREIYVDDAAALGAKYDLVNRLGLRGVGMWALGYDGDRTELWSMLNAKFLHDTTLPEAGVLPLPLVSRDEGFVVRWTGTDDKGISRYDVQVSVDGGAWSPWLTGTTATSDVWLGGSGHAYSFRVRALDVSGNWSAWNVVNTTSSALVRGGFATVTADGLSVRSAADTSASRLATLDANDILAITGGPVAADGYTWYQVTGPLESWGTVGEVQVGGWVAAGNSTTTFMVGRQSPSLTSVSGAITGLRVGDGPTATRLVTPNGNGILDTIAIRWTNTIPLDALSLKIYTSGGTLLGSQSVTALGTGAQSFAWNARLNGSALAPGRYAIQLVGTAGASTYTAPSTRPVTSVQLAQYGVTVDSVDSSRLAGPNRYATAAAISRATFAPGAAVAYIVNGYAYADGIAAAAAAAAVHGPILSVAATNIPSETATELTRLKPGRIVILGSTGTVSDGVRLALDRYTAGTVSRLAGPNRYATAAAISRATFAPGAAVAYIVNGYAYADGIAAAAAAAAVHGPILSVAATNIPSETATELTRLKPGRIVILGSTGTVSEALVGGLIAAARG